MYSDFVKGKKVLQIGLGLLGGGVATARFLVSHGAKLTIMDSKTEDELKQSLDLLEDLDIHYILGKEDAGVVLESDMLVINPGVWADNKLVELARENGKEVENELTLFYRYCKSANIVAVTGTRGKTTVVHWIHHFLKFKDSRAIMCGNSPEKPMLALVDSIDTGVPVVVETPSYQLEIMRDFPLAPHVAVITNLFQDHLNRHYTMENYAGIKANIFHNQSEQDFLILNKDNKWTKFFLEQEPKAKVEMYSRESDLVQELVSKTFVDKWGEHNAENLAAAAVAAAAVGVSIEQMQEALDTLPSVKFRQEKVYEQEGVAIYNDSAATSPEAGIAAIRRFSGLSQSLILIAGGTDGDLDYTEWAKVVSEKVSPESLVLLSGTATEKMKEALEAQKYEVRSKSYESDNLKECLDKAMDIAKDNGGGNIVFSLSAKSFGPFKNEFDRGNRFNGFVRGL